MTPDDRNLCSFCCETREDVVQGALGSICPDCIDLCRGVLDQRANPKPLSPKAEALKQAVEQHLDAVTAVMKD